MSNQREKTLLRIQDMCMNMRKTGLEIALAAGSSATHFGGGLSLIDILATLYGGVMKYNVLSPSWEERDRFILSKGHGVLGYYAVLHEVGFIPKEDLLTFEKNETYLAGHPVQNIERGIEFTNGSLGMGLSIGIGVALAAKKKNRAYKTYVLMGDGECNEGSIWEAAMAAAQFKLDNLIAIIDKNSFQLGGTNEEIMSIGDVGEKFHKFGWQVREVDGHDIEQLYDAFTSHKEAEKPMVVVANTIKGKGFTFSENNNAWHHAILTSKQYQVALEELLEGDKH
jgi:transketolase